jgi:hypothetical protein
MSALAHPLTKIESALDRFREAHFWIHALEQFYHRADPFRWHLNAFLKSLKEVPQLLAMGLQNEPGFSEWFSAQRDQLMSDPLMRFLSKKRDFVVHRGILVPNSQGSIGVTEGRSFKLGIGFSVHPLEDSDDAMDRYLRSVGKGGDFLGLLVPDEDSIPCVRRIWRMPPFDQEIIDVAAQGWLRTGETINAVVQWLGMAPEKLSLGCRHSSQKVRFKLYDRDKLNEELAKIHSETGN